MQIYKITNLINDKFYIGKTTKTLAKRWEKHQKHNKCPKLYNAIQKYGASNFKIENVEFCTSLKELNEREKYWIRILNATKKGYNIAKGGDGGAMTGEALEKIRYHAKIREYSEKTRKLMSNNTSGSRNPRAKKVIVTLEDGVQIGFYCIKYASEFLGISDSAGRALVRGIEKPLRRKVKISYVRES